MTTRRPAEAFPPGEFVREELDARGWTAETLAERSGLTGEALNNLLGTSHYPMTHDIATGLSKAFGSSVTFWLNLERSYTEWIAARAD